MILCAGAAGLLGSAIASELAKRALRVRALVRHTTDIQRIADIAGVEISRCDLHNPDELHEALQGVETVISSFATNIAKSPRAGPLWQNDYEGNLALIKAARCAGVKKIIFISYWGLAKFGGFEHGKIKKVVEDLLQVSGIDYTVLRVTTLATDMSLLTGRSLQRRGWAPMLMRRHEKIRPVLLEDLAWCVADAISNPQAANSIIEIGGREEYSIPELEKLFCTAIGRKIRFIYVPLPLAYAAASFIDLCTAQKYNARGLVSAFTGGSTCDISHMQQVFRHEQQSFAQYLQDFFQPAGSAIQ